MLNCTGISVQCIKLIAGYPLGVQRVWKYKLGSRIGYQIDVEVGMRGMRRAQVHVKLFQKKTTCMTEEVIRKHKRFEC